MKNFEQKLVEKKYSSLKFIVILTISFLILVLILSFLLSVKQIKINYLPKDNHEIASLSVNEGYALVLSNTVFILSEKITLGVTGNFNAFEIVVYKNSNSLVDIYLPTKKINVVLKVNFDTKVSNPIETNWYVNENFFGSGQEVTLNLTNGNYNIKTTHPFHKSEETLLTIENNKSIVKKIKLQRLFGILDIEVSPSDANITVNNNPYINKKYLAGIHKVSIFKTGYKTIHDELNLDINNLNLKRKYSLTKNDVDVIFKPNILGGNLTVNGKNTLVNKKIKIPANTDISIRYERPGYSDFYLVKKFSKNENFRFDIEKEFGEVLISSYPKAGIFINDNFFSMTPFKGKMQTNEKEITLKKEGYKSKKINVRPRLNFVEEYHEDLITLKEFYLKKSSKKYKSSVGLDLVLINPNNAQFNFGSSADEVGRRANEFSIPVKMYRHFYVGTTEVTEGAYSLFLNQMDKKNSLLPVTNISWLDAVKFCNWLSSKEGLDNFYQIQNKDVKFNWSSRGYRLLTEAEWEFLSKIYKKYNGSKFPWGDEFIIPNNTANLSDASNAGKRPYIANYNDGSTGVANVGSYEPSQSGLYDLAGNVREWVNDFYNINYYLNLDNNLKTDHKGPSKGTANVVKGSSYLSHSLTDLRNSYKTFSSSKSNEIGFRIARYLY